MVKNLCAFASRLLFCALCLSPLVSHANTEGYFTYNVSDGHATITRFDSSYDGSLSIPSTLGGYPVTAIGDNAFLFCMHLISVTIPASVGSIGNDAFANCTALYSVTFGLAGTTAIGNRAFYNCGKLVSITLPDTVQSIGDEAFAFCSALSSLNIPANLTSIGNSAFWYCTSLVEFTVGPLASFSYTSSGGVIFNKTFTSLVLFPSGRSGVYTIPGSVTSIGASAFSGGNLTSVIIPGNLTSIGTYAFSRCIHLTSITIPGSVTSIGASAFSDCEGLTDITIPPKVTSIGSNAFAGCIDLTCVLFYGNAPTSVGASIFTNTPATVYYFSDMNGWGSTFGGRPAICAVTWTALDGQTTITGLDSSYAGPLSFPPVLGGCPITSFGPYAFYGCAGLSAITIPDGVKNIDLSAFGLCTGLTSVAIPRSVTNINTFAFTDCEKLTNIAVTAENPIFASSNGVLFNKPLSTIILCPKGKQGTYTIPVGVNTIGESAFFECNSLTSFTFPSGVISIADNAFRACTGLTSITLPDSVTHIGENVFFNCTGLTSVTLPNRINAIGANTFSGCTSLTSVKIPDSVRVIGDGAFFDCNGLTSVVIPRDVTDIGWYAFADCGGLTAILFQGAAPIPGSYVFDATPATVYYIPDQVGWGTTFGDRPTASVIYWVIQQGQAVITDIHPAYFGPLPIPPLLDGLPVTLIADWAFDGHAGLTSVTLPDSVSDIGVGAFEGCSGLTNLVFGVSTRSIGERAFSGCAGLQSITFPANVCSIGGGAFEGCTGLAFVIFRSGGVTIDNFAFASCSSLNSALFLGDAPAHCGTYAFYKTPSILYNLPGKTGWGTTFGGRPVLCWNPTVQPGAHFGFSAGRFTFEIAGTANIPIAVEATTNLVSGVWTQVTNTTLGASGSIRFSDPWSAARASRYYRIVWPQAFRISP